MGLLIWLRFKFVRCFVANTWDCLRAASFAFVSFFCAVACLVCFGCFLELFFVAVFFGVRGSNFFGKCLMGEIVCLDGAREGPGLSTGVDCAVGARDGPGMFDICTVDVGAGWLCPGSFVISSAFRLRFSSKQNFSIFFLYWLYSPIDLQATKIISRNLGSSGFSIMFVLCVMLAVAFDIAISLFLITVFFLL